MNCAEYYEEIKLAFEHNGLADLISRENAEKLFLLSNMLAKANETTNLTAITDEAGILLKHFIDSATISPLIGKGMSVVDVGCGAGFPTLPLAILRSDLKIVALDSTGKKINFVEAASRELSLGNVFATCARAEDFVKENRQAFDVSTSRAVARMNILAELCLPLVKTGGSFIAMKSNKGAEELLEAENGVKLLGGRLKQTYCKRLQHGNEVIEREIYVFEKQKDTPTLYPRKYAQIVKKPL